MNLQPQDGDNLLRRQGKLWSLCLHISSRRLMIFLFQLKEQRLYSRGQTSAKNVPFESLQGGHIRQKRKTSVVVRTSTDAHHTHPYSFKLFGQSLRNPDFTRSLANLLRWVPIWECFPWGHPIFFCKLKKTSWSRLQYCCYLTQLTIT